MKTKPTVGIFSFTSCGGCQQQILNMEDSLLEMAHQIDLRSFHLLNEKNAVDGKFDIAFIEGAISLPKELEELKKIRDNTKFLVAMGACATFGGIPHIRNIYEEKKVEEMVYHDETIVDSIPVSGIDSHVKVDCYLQGCPMFESEFMFVLKSLLAGKIPRIESKPVCSECRSRNFRCMFNEVPCLGPVTLAGCNALCMENGYPCEGCRGPTEDSNLETEIALFKKHGMSAEEIRQRLKKFAGGSKQLTDENLRESGL